MYCVYCGVKLQDGAGECPLCHTPVVIPEKPGTAGKTLYSDRMPAEEKSARWRRGACFLERPSW